MSDVVACPACGAENPAQAKFCMDCGTPLAASSAIAEERKVITSLFCDLVGFTAMTEAADPEDVDRLLGEYSERTRKVIESHGGTVEKFIGDAVVGVFGVPAVHEDDPERAVRAGLRVIEALEGLTRPDGTPLEARVGINTGEALVRLDVDPASGRGFLRGDAVNTAARLQAAAPPGGVAVGALTHELTTGAIEYEGLPPVAARGKAEPVRAWRALAPLARRGIDTHAGDLTPLVGREVELSYLSAVFEKAVSQSAPQFVLLVGEPGIGKSRLVGELAALVDARPQMTTWRQGYCSPFGEEITYRALAEIVKGHAGMRDNDPLSTVEAKLGAVLPSGPDREWFRQRLRALLGLEAPEARREENFTAWLRFFEDLAAREPTVLVFEDLHWADEALLAFLEHLATHLAAVPLLVLGTARPELFERAPGFASGGAVNRITVGPLSPAETQRLVAGLVGEPDDRAEAVHRVVDRCEGNPFYAEQSVRLLSDTAPETPLPDSVQAVIAARLDALSAAQKALLGDAAVVGGVFWEGALVAVAAHDPEELQGLLSALLERQLIRRIRESAMAGEQEYAFVHALAREVAYGQLPRALRARKHAAVADWLEKKAGARAEDLAEVLAHHSLTAVELARASGEAELAESLLESAVERAAAAGERAMRLDVQAAKRYIERGLEVTGDDGPGRGRLLFGLCEATAHEGDLTRGLELTYRAADSYRREGDVRGEARAKWFGSTLLTWMCRPEADQLLDEAVRLADAIGPTPVTLEILIWKAYRDWLRTGDPAQELADCDQVIALARELGEPDPVVPLSRACAARIDLGDATALHDHDQVLETALAKGLGDESAVLMFNNALLRESVEGPEEARKAFLRTIEFADSRGLEDCAAPARGGLVEALWLGGEWYEALDLLESATSLLEAAELVFDLVPLKTVSALLLLLQGETSAARAQFEWVATKDLARMPLLKTPVLAAEAALRFAAGERDESRRLLGQWVEHRHSATDASLAVFAVIALRMALALSDVKLAQRIVDVYRGPLPVQDFAGRSMNALLAEARGEHEAAAAGFADAAARWHEFGIPYEEAQALLGRGRCLLALGRAPEAAQPLREAREIFARLGARPALEETEDWLAQAGPA